MLEKMKTVIFISVLALALNAEDFNTKHCLTEPEEGLCRGYFESYFYDYKSRSCKTFIYGGCGGNGNRFASEDDCIDKCGDVIVMDSESICDLPPTTGHCYAAFRRFYFDKESGRCRNFIYGGCGGNANNFRTEDECNQRCGKTECGLNSHFESCGTACPLTCENYQDPPKMCVLRCDIGCQCDEGYVRSAEGRCVKPFQCPLPSNNIFCGENSHFERCGSACPLTCENYKRPPIFCVKSCGIGCDCDEGYVKTANGKCVKPEQCPSSANPIEKNCSDKPDSGFCMAYFPMWSFDVETQKCRRFIYGGCGGNGNRYNTEEECMKNCKA